MNKPKHPAYIKTPKIKNVLFLFTESKDSPVNVLALRR